MEKRRQIDVMEAEVLRKEKELVATIHRSAEADRFQVYYMLSVFIHLFFFWWFLLRLTTHCAHFLGRDDCRG